MCSTSSSTISRRFFNPGVFLAALVGMVAWTPVAPGQAVPPAAANKSANAPGDDPAIELSPFTIVADKETGWVATQTLAGSRMKTDFKDIAQPIEVMTKEFMDDLALTNYEEAVLYSTNIEGPQDRVDFGSAPSGAGVGNIFPKNGMARRRSSNTTIRRSRPNASITLRPITDCPSIRGAATGLISWRTITSRKAGSRA